MKLARDVDAFSLRLGHSFADPELLVRALTHSSISSETRPDNQRLEFLGDRVLGLVMADALSAADKDAREGQLAPRFNALVRKEACAEVAEEIALGEVLKLGRSEMMSGGRRKQALLADALEAVIAAVYLDGGFECARACVLKLWGRRVETVDEDSRDAKTSLQELAQARGLGLPQYSEVSRDGPDHAPTFVVKVQVASGEIEQGRATSKRKAEQAAAQLLLTRLEEM